jgi:hypothetical protein
MKVKNLKEREFEDVDGQEFHGGLWEGEKQMDLWYGRLLYLINKRV